MEQLFFTACPAVPSRPIRKSEFPPWAACTDSATGARISQSVSGGRRPVLLVRMRTCLPCGRAVDLPAGIPALPVRPQKRRLSPSGVLYRLGARPQSDATAPYAQVTQSAVRSGARSRSGVPIRPGARPARLRFTQVCARPFNRKMSGLPFIMCRTRLNVPRGTQQRAEPAYAGPAPSPSGSAACHPIFFCAPEIRAARFLGILIV